MGRKFIDIDDGDIEGFIDNLTSNDLKRREHPKPNDNSELKTMIGSEQCTSNKKEVPIPQGSPTIPTHSKQYQYPDYSEYNERSRKIREKIHRESHRKQNLPTTDEYVSRAAMKLGDAVKTFGYDFTDKIVLDIGSSTGGFTEYALAHGASKVIAIEKGTNQMSFPLREDPNIDLHEKTDIFKVTHYMIGDIDTILADVSFVSLTKILSYVKKELAHRGYIDFLVMLKPQFEAEPSQLIRGVVKNERIRRDIIKNFESWCKHRGFVIKAKRDNGIPGRNGNLERFYWLILSR